MDATPLSEKATPAAATAADTVPSAAQHAAEQSSSSSPESAAAAVAGEDDDEQVERFYALLDNIRAMKGMVSTGGTAAAGRRKRARDAEPPWRPAFRMEDFELEEVDSDSVGCAGERNKKRDSSAKRPADDEEQEQGEVADEATKGRRREQPQSQSHSHKGGVLAVVDT